MIQASRQHGPGCAEALDRGDLDDLCPDCLALVREDTEPWGGDR